MLGRNRPVEVAIDIASDVAAIAGAVDSMVKCCAGACRDPKRLLFNFRIGLTEALSNAILYGNAGSRKKLVRIELRTVPGEIRVRVSDEGPGFSPCSIPDPRLPENLSKPAGRGVFLMQALMDEVHFNAAGNAVTLVLRDRPGRPAADAGAGCR